MLLIEGVYGINITLTLLTIGGIGKVGLEDAARRTAARQQTVDAAKAQHTARQAAEYQAYDTAVAELNPLMRRFGDAISRQLSAYGRKYGPGQGRAFRRAKQFSDRFSVKKTAFSTNHAVAPGISVTILGVDRYDVFVTIEQFVGSRANKLTVCPERDYWMFETVHDPASAREGVFLFQKTLAHGPEDLCNFEWPARFGGCLKREYTSNWRFETNQGFDFRAVIEELIVVFLDHCDIPYSSVTAPAASALTAGITVARASIGTPHASATPAQSSTKERIDWLVGAIAVLLVVSGMLAWRGSSLAGWVFVVSFFGGLTLLASRNDKK